MRARLLDAVQDYQTWLAGAGDPKSKVYHTESNILLARIESRRLQLNTCMADVEVARAAVVAAEAFYPKDDNA